MSNTWPNFLTLPVSIDSSGAHYPPQVPGLLAGHPGLFFQPDMQFLERSGLRQSLLQWKWSVKEWSNHPTYLNVICWIILAPFYFELEISSDGIDWSAPGFPHFNPIRAAFHRVEGCLQVVPRSSPGACAQR